MQPSSNLFAQLNLGRRLVSYAEEKPLNQRGFVRSPLYIHAVYYVVRPSTSHSLHLLCPKTRLSVLAAAVEWRQALWSIIPDPLRSKVSGFLDCLRLPGGPASN